MKLRKYRSLREQWLWDDRPSEFYLVQSGSQPVGSGIDATNFQLALGPLVKQAKGELFQLPFGVDSHVECQRGDRYTRCDGFTQHQVDEFWCEWDRLASLRQNLFHHRNVDWSEMASLITQSNKLMRISPHRRLRRIALLARRPPDLDLMCPDCIIYCICGPHPPYIGQCGAINGPRPPLDRFCEHCRKGRSLTTKYLGRQCKAHTRAIRLGRLPSLPGLIAKYGMGCMTMYLVERVQPSLARQRQRFWDRVHAPTADQKTPFGGVDRLVWE